MSDWRELWWVVGVVQLVVAAGFGIGALASKQIRTNDGIGRAILHAIAGVIICVAARHLAWIP